MTRRLPDRSAVSALLTDLARHGVQFSRRGDDGLHCVRSAGAIDPDLVARIKPFKWLLLAMAMLRDDVRDVAARESLCTQFDTHAVEAEANGLTQEQAERAAFELIRDAVARDLTVQRARRVGGRS